MRSASKQILPSLAIVATDCNKDLRGLGSYVDSVENYEPHVYLYTKCEERVGLPSSWNVVHAENVGREIGTILDHIITGPIHDYMVFIQSDLDVQGWQGHGKNLTWERTLGALQALDTGTSIASLSFCVECNPKAHPKGCWNQEWYGDHFSRWGWRKQWKGKWLAAVRGQLAVSRAGVEVMLKKYRQWWEEFRKVSKLGGANAHFVTYELERLFSLIFARAQGQAPTRDHIWCPDIIEDNVGVQ